MLGRLSSIKKSYWLFFSAIINILLFLSGSIFCYIFFDLYNAWFFIFCICVGCQLIIKSLLFHYDSSCYMGTVLFLVGIFYFYSIILNLYYLYPVFILLSFSMASLITFYFYKQPYHFILALSLFFVTLALLFFLINKISIYIFLAILLLSVILLIVKYFTLK